MAEDSFLERVTAAAVFFATIRIFSEFLETQAVPIRE